ncbi:MAG: DegT/DnrJ/EryC1/StrS family aminotransferase, partial [Candidatus Peribacteraceae bacterium]|nr:DegT/DnrJ/EryC1/StrS family aminotransferase [Candidatus Peribacteraceae bacterium]
YDAAHAFGVQINNNSILNYGEMSILSFHATKMFNTMEGGAIICQDEKTKQRIDYAKNFGFAGETTVVVPGINAKLNEMQSSLGLLQLKQHKDNVNKRKSIAEKYRNALSKIPGVTLLPVADNVKWNYGYFPIFIDEAAFGWNRDYLYEKLKDANIFCRRYFYPLISQFSPYRGLPSADSKNLPTAIEVANKVLCLPIYSELEDHTLEKIFKIIKS